LFCFDTSNNNLCKICFASIFSWLHTNPPWVFKEKINNLLWHSQLIWSVQHALGVVWLSLTGN
jgi:hypothetical protein